MKRIEDIKEFKDIDTYYEISKIVDEVFQDRVEAHKHLVTANKEIERLKSRLKEYQEYVEINHKEIERLNNIINELEKYINGRIEYCYNNGTYQDVFDVYNEFDMKLQELKGSDN